MHFVCGYWRQYDHRHLLPVSDEWRERILPDPMGAGEHDREDRRAQRSRKTKRARPERRLDPEHRTLRKEHHVLPCLHGRLRCCNQLAIARSALFRLDADVPHPPKRRADPWPLEYLLPRDVSHHQRELAQTQCIGETLVPGHDEMW